MGRRRMPGTQSCSGFRVTRSGKRLKSRSVVHSSVTPCAMHIAAIRRRRGPWLPSPGRREAASSARSSAGASRRAPRRPGIRARRRPGPALARRSTEDRRFAGGSRLRGTRECTAGAAPGSLSGANGLSGAVARESSGSMGSGALARRPCRCLLRTGSLLRSGRAEVGGRKGGRRPERRDPRTGDRGVRSPPRRGPSGWPNDSRSPSSTTTR